MKDEEHDIACACLYVARGVTIVELNLFFIFVLIICFYLPQNRILKVGMSEDGSKKGMMKGGKKGAAGSMKGMMKAMKGKVGKSDIATRMIGAYTATEVEAAFGLEQGSLIMPGDKGFDKLSKKNSWSDYYGIPIVLERIELIAMGQGIISFFQIVDIIKTVVSFSEEGMLELPFGGCFYSPKDPSTEAAFTQAGLDACYSFAPYLVTWTLVGYVDESTRLMISSIGSLSAGRVGSVDDLVDMTQLVLFRAPVDLPLQGEELFAYTAEGPNYGDWAGYASPGLTFDAAAIGIAGNLGKTSVAVEAHDVAAPCPDKYCGFLIPGFIPNPLAPAWPEQIEVVQCEMFFNSDIPACE
jgi:hypothetical protein